MRLSLVESYCLPILQYCCAAYKLSVVHTKELNACWNVVYRKNFGFSKSESVTAFICGISRLNYKHVIAVAHFKLLKSLFASNNRVLKTLCATHIVRADFMNLCSEYGVTLNLT